MYSYFTKSIILLVLFSTTVFSQTEKKEAEIKTDTTVILQKYGLRLGADISKVVRSFFDDNYQGFEINADYRLTQKIYLSGELGNEERTLDSEVLNTTTSGSYFKGGIDINLYKNWLDMENLIFSGFRVGASTFSQTINSGTISDVNNQLFGGLQPLGAPREFDGLSAIWGELIIGIKAEVLNNLFMGLNVQLKFLVTDTAPNNFENLYIPGFNRTFDSGGIGAGFGYNISYLIPIYKKAKKKKVEEEEEDSEIENGGS